MGLLFSAFRTTSPAPPFLFHCSSLRSELCLARFRAPVPSAGQARWQDLVNITRAELDKGECLLQGSQTSISHIPLSCFLARSVAPNQVSVPPRGAFGNVWRYFWSSQPEGVWGMLLASSRWGPEMLLNTLHSTGQLRAKLDYLPPNATRIEFERTWTRSIFLF